MRRRLLLIIAALSCIMLVAGCSSNENEGQAKYIFLMIGDGMGNSQVAVAESYLSYKDGKFGGEQVTFTKFPVLGTCTTYSADKAITCSSASGTAIATGFKTNNGMLGVTPEGKPLKSMAYMLKEQGYKVGIMSSVPVNHATLASFYAHNERRGDYYNISKEISDTGFEFFGGAGFLQFNGSKEDEKDIDLHLQENGYTVCYGKDEFEKNADRSDKIVLIQESGRKTSAANYTSAGQEKEDMGLGEMMELAIEYLGDDQPFFVMCEGGEIDWCAHSNKAMPMIEAVMNFDDAVAEAYKFYLEHPDETLIVVTADHETGGVAIGYEKNDSQVDWKLLEESHKTFTDSKDDNKAINLKGNIGWTTTDHTGSPVPVYAIGKGAERFAGRMDNTDIIKKIVLK